MRWTQDRSGAQKRSAAQKSEKSLFAAGKTVGEPKNDPKMAEKQHFYRKSGFLSILGPEKALKPEIWLLGRVFRRGAG